jgi:hypothetical protein
MDFLKENIQILSDVTNQAKSTIIVNLSLFEYNEKSILANCYKYEIKTANSAALG